MKKKRIVVLIAVFLICVVGFIIWRLQKEKQLNYLEALEIQSFSLTFGTNGISSYDSSTGTLIKTTDATYPEDYITTMFFDETKWKEIVNLLKELDIQDYPEEYDPINSPYSLMKKASSPSMTLSLTVSTKEWTKTVTCNDMAYSWEGYNKKSQKFLDTCKKLQAMIVSTKEWTTLPEYEFFYE